VQRVELTVWEDGVPMVGDEGPINYFHGRMSVLVTPFEEVTIEVYLLQGRLVDEATKHSH
jgi:hypothetical protein